MFLVIIVFRVLSCFCGACSVGPSGLHRVGLFMDRATPCFFIRFSICNFYEYSRLFPVSWSAHACFEIKRLVMVCCSTYCTSRSFTVLSVSESAGRNCAGVCLNSAYFLCLALGRQLACVSFSLDCGRLLAQNEPSFSAGHPQMGLVLCDGWWPVLPVALFFCVHPASG